MGEGKLMSPDDFHARTGETITLEALEAVQAHTIELCRRRVCDGCARGLPINNHDLHVELSASGNHLSVPQFCAARTIPPLLPAPETLEAKSGAACAPAVE